MQFVVKMYFELFRGPSPAVDRPAASLCWTQLQLDPEQLKPTASPTYSGSFLGRDTDTGTKIGWSRGKSQTTCSLVWPGMWVNGVGLTVCCGRVSVSLISPQKHVEWQVGDVVALLIHDTEKHDASRQQMSGVKFSSHGDAAWSKMAAVTLPLKYYET